MSTDERVRLYDLDCTYTRRYLSALESERSRYERWWAARAGDRR